MGEVVKLLRPVVTIFVGLFTLLVTSAPALGQQMYYMAFERCAGLPAAAPDSPFDGLLVTVDADAARAFRAEISTTYVLSFSGGNFLAAGAVSPDGRYYAVPNGIISTISTSDVRYVVQEIRILTTETVPRIVRRLPWRASFPVGTLFTSGGDIPPLRWLDVSTIQFVSGTISEGQQPVTIDVFAEGAAAAAVPDSGLSLSPDGSRRIAYVAGQLALIDTATGESVASLPQMPHMGQQIAWSPDNSQFALTALSDGAVSLGLYDKNGGLSATIAALPAEEVLWNVRWSPDGSKIAFTAFDPQTIENRLHVADVAGRTITDTCLPLLADVDGSPLGVLAWSPDSTRIAIMTAQAAPEAQIQIYAVGDRTRYNLIPAAGRLLGWYP